MIIYTYRIYSKPIVYLGMLSNSTSNGSLLLGNMLAKTRSCVSLDPFARCFKYLFKDSSSTE